MANEHKVPYAKKSLTANGGSNGLVSVDTTINFRKAARVYLQSNSVPAKELIVDEVIDSQTLALRDPSVIGTVRYACNAYTLADAATITQPEQEDLYTLDDDEVVSGNLVVDGNITSTKPIIATNVDSTTAEIYLTVSVGGSDIPTDTRPTRILSGDHSAEPFATVQAALNALPKNIRHLTTVKLGAGNHAGFVVDGFVAGAAAKDEHPLLRITGTMALATVATGPNAGTATSGSSTTLVHTGAGWTVNDLAGKLVRLVTGNGSAANSPASQNATVLGRIRSNTADTITLWGNFEKLPRQDIFNAMYPSPSGTPGAGTTYEIVEPASIVQLETNIPSRAVCIETTSEMVEIDQLSIGAATQAVALKAMGKNNLIVWFNKFPVAASWAHVDLTAVRQSSVNYNYMTAGARPYFAQYSDGYTGFQRNRIENATGPAYWTENAGFSIFANNNEFFSGTSPSILSVGNLGHVVGNIFNSCAGPLIDIQYSSAPTELVSNGGTSLPATGVNFTRAANATFSTSQAFGLTIDGTTYTAAELAAYDGVQTRYSKVMPAV